MLYNECSEDGFNLTGLINEASDANVPVFISQLSRDCSKNMFDAIFGKFGTGTDNAWSGGIVSDWLFGSWDRNAGMVNYGSTLTRELGVYTMEPTTSVNVGKPTPVSDEWAALSSKWSRVADITGVKIGDPSHVTTPICPPSSSPAWNITGDVKLPTLIDRAEPISTSGKTEPTPTNKKKNGGSSLGFDIRGLYLVFASLMGLNFGL
jgi:hypothetical protein